MGSSNLVLNHYTYSGAMPFCWRILLLDQTQSHGLPRKSIHHHFHLHDLLSPRQVHPSPESDDVAKTDVKLGLGVVPFTYSAEVFPTLNRGMFVPDHDTDQHLNEIIEAGMSLAVFINLFGAGILGLFVPFLKNTLGGLGLLELFAQVPAAHPRSTFTNSIQRPKRRRIRPDIHLCVRNETRAT
jgi:hypothetical protein